MSCVASDLGAMSWPLDSHRKLDGRSAVAPAPTGDPATPASSASAAVSSRTTLLVRISFPLHVENFDRRRTGKSTATAAYRSTAPSLAVAQPVRYFERTSEISIVGS